MSFFHSKSITAKLVGHNLVASFATANPPLIWKFDLERNHSFTIALQGDAGDWELGITSPKGEFYPVAHFPMKEDAEEALAKVQKVLMKKKRSLFWGIVRWLVTLLLVGILVFCAWSYLTFRMMSPMVSQGLSSGLPAGLPGGRPAASFGGPPPLPMPAMQAAPAITPGVPLSADDVLQPPH
jgi:hypothetical protein